MSGRMFPELRISIDSLRREVDSLGNMYGSELTRYPYFSLPYDSRLAQDEAKGIMDIDSVFANPPSQARTYINLAITKAKRRQQEYEYKTLVLKEQSKLMRRHDIELQRRFTLSVACLVFFL